VILGTIGGDRLLHGHFIAALADTIDLVLTLRRIEGIALRLDGSLDRTGVAVPELYVGGLRRAGTAEKCDSRRQCERFHHALADFAASLFGPACDGGFLHFMCNKSMTGQKA